MKRIWMGRDYMRRHFPPVAEELNIKPKQYNCLTTNKTMGLENNEPKTYLSIVDGKITKRVKEGSPGAIERTNSEGTKVWELRWDCLTGFLQSMTTRLGKFGREWLIEIGDRGELFQLQLSFNGGYAKGILLSMPNLDFSKEIKFSPWQKEVIGEDKKTQKRTALYLAQPNGETFAPRETGDQVKWYYTKEEPNGLPPLVETVFKGEKAFDDTHRMAFLEDQFINDWSLKIKNAATNRGAGVSNGQGEPSTHTPEVPFGTHEPTAHVPGKITPNPKAAQYTEEVLGPQPGDDDLPF